MKQITHLLFADDTLVFCKDSGDQMTHLCWILAWFEALLGLKINLEKSSPKPVGKVEDVERLASELRCNIGSLPTKYLGLPLGAKHKTARVWDGVEERFRRGWIFGKVIISPRAEDSLLSEAPYPTCPPT